MRSRLRGILGRWLKSTPLAEQREMPDRFVVLAMQRTGSTMVVSALNSHPDIFCHRELFRSSSAATAGLRGLDARFHDPAFREAHPEEYLEAIYGLGHEARFIGFKLLLSQHPVMRDRLIEDARYCKILLRRDNVLARYSSQRLLEATRAGSVAEGGKVEFVERDFLKYRRYHNRFFDETRRRLEEARRPYFELSYAEACTSAGLSRVLTAIGADASVELRVGTVGGNSPDIVSRFSNPDAVENFLTRNHLEHWRSEEPA